MRFCVAFLALAGLQSATCRSSERAPSHDKPLSKPGKVTRPRSASPLKGTSAFGRRFADRTLRIDLEHRGSKTTESYRVVALVREGPWAGSRSKLSDPFDFGAHRFEAHDARTGALLYSRGYSSLFGEWQTTPDAKKGSKAFSESLRLPLPRAPFTLVISSRNKKGKLTRVFGTRIDPGDAKVRDWRRDPRLVAESLHHCGPDHLCLDVLIIGDGYSAREREKFRRDAHRFNEVLLRSTGFGPHRNRMNVRALFVPSPVSGVNEPRRGRPRQTPLGLSFNTFGSPRYLMTERNLALRRIAAHAPYDALYLMANTSRYGGGGIYNLYSTFPSDNEYDDYVFIHEFGHAFGGLGDEYYDSQVSYSGFYPRGVEPWEPNITAHLGGRLKWRAMVGNEVPIPTPNEARYGKVVGLFEGAGYSAKGLYRPQLDCKMLGKGHQPFCRVCADAINRIVRLYSN